MVVATTSVAPLVGPGAGSPPGGRNTQLSNRAGEFATQYLFILGSIQNGSARYRTRAGKR